jgi:flagellar assembly protein FliH
VASRVWKQGAVGVSPIPWRGSARGAPRIAPDEPARPESADEISRLRTQLAELASARELDRRQAYESGYQAAEAATSRHADETVRAVVERLAEAVAEISSLRAETIARAESDTVRLAVEIARRILHREIALDPSALHALIKAALEKLRSQEISRIRIHPDLEGVLRTALGQAGRTQSIEIVCDPAQPEGGAVFEISQGALDASVDTQLREIERGLADRLETRK